MYSIPILHVYHANHSGSKILGWKHMVNISDQLGSSQNVYSAVISIHNYGSSNPWVNDLDAAITVMSDVIFFL